MTACKWPFSLPAQSSFATNYSINGWQEAITFGRYGLEGTALAEARERLGEAKKRVATGKSPDKEKARTKVRTKGAETFDTWAENSGVAIRWWTRHETRKRAGAAPTSQILCPSTRKTAQRIKGLCVVQGGLLTSRGPARSDDPHLRRGSSSMPTSGSVRHYFRRAYSAVETA